jgi:hypothetical protein
MRDPHDLAYTTAFIVAPGKQRYRQVPPSILGHHAYDVSGPANAFPLWRSQDHPATALLQRRRSSIACRGAVGLRATSGHVLIPQPFDPAAWSAALADANVRGRATSSTTTGSSSA